MTGKPDRVKFLYLVGQLGAGGMERQLVYLLKAMDRERFRPAIAVWDGSQLHPYGEVLTEMGVPIIALPHGQSPLAKVARLHRFVRRSHVELVHSCSFYLNPIASTIVCGTKARAVGSIRSDLIADWAVNRPVVRLAGTRWPRDQICNSEAALRNVRRLPGIRQPARLTLVRNAVDVDEVAAADLPDTGSPLIVGIGSLSDLKRWDRLVRALARLRHSGIEARARVAGRGPAQPALEALATELGVRSSLELPGYVRDVADFLAQSQVLVHTSSTEGSPNSVMEAMAAARPVVAFAAGDIPYLVDDGVTGFVLAQDDEAGFVDRLSLLLRDRALCQRFGAAGRARAVAEFGIDRLLDETLAAYGAAGVLLS